MRRLVIFLGAIISLSQVSSAADFRPVDPEYPTGWIMEGVIEQGDSLKLLSVIKSQKGGVMQLILYSPGGSFYEAMDIGRIVRDFGITVSVPHNVGFLEDVVPNCPRKPVDERNCIAASATAMIYFAAVRKSGSILGVHRPYFSKGSLAETSPLEAEKLHKKLISDAGEYLRYFEVPNAIIELMLSTPSNRISWIEKSEMISLQGDAPFFEEFIINRCSIMTENEKADYYKFQDIGSYHELPDEQRAYFSTLLSKNAREVDCRDDIDEIMIKDAFLKYFGEEATYFD